MASDNLNQVGRGLRRTRRDVDFALTRVKKNVPRIERIRDVFDTDIPFEMSFDTKRNDTTVFMDINFNKPPPVGECETAECVKQACDSFELEAGNHYVNVTTAYLPGTVAVFLDGVPILPSQYEEMGGTEVYIQSESLDQYTATICYLHSDQSRPCVEDSDCVPDEPKAYLGLARLFYDNFTKMNPDPGASEGDCGSWIDGDTGLPPTNVDWDGFGAAGISDNAILINGTSGPLWEALYKIRFDSASQLVDIDCRMNQGLGDLIGNDNIIRFDIGARSGTNRTLTIQAPAEAIDSLTPFSIPWVATNGSASTSMAVPEGIYYLRIAQIINSGWVMKLWDASITEPAAWSLSLFTLPTPPANTSNLQWKFINLSSINHENFTASVYSVTVWGDQSRGRWTAYETSASTYLTLGAQWESRTCYPGDGQPRFGHCDPYEVVITGPFGHTGVADDDAPDVLLRVSFPFFGGGIGDGQVANFSVQNTAAYTEVPIGLLHFEGEMRITGANEWTGYPCTILFDQTDLTDEPPELEWLPGDQISSYTGTINEAYHPFSFDLNDIDGKIQWSIRVADPHALAVTLPKVDNGFLSPPTGNLGVSFKNIRIFADGLLLCTAHSSCFESEESLNLRCGPTAFQFNGTDLPQYCGNLPGSATLSVETYLEIDSGQSVHVEQDVGTGLDFEDGEVIIGFKARGTSTTNAFPLCRRSASGTVDLYNDRSSTSAFVDLNFAAPFMCEESAEATFEFFTPRIVPAPQWQTTAGSSVVGLTRTPNWFLSFGGMNNGAPWIEINAGQGFADTYSNGITPSYNNSSSTVTAGVWWTIKFRVDKTGEETGIFYAKFWESGTTEPSTWLIQGTGNQPMTTFDISLGYDDFVDDDFYLKLRNFTSTVL